MSTTINTTDAPETYKEAHKKFLAWRPVTKQREGPNGMTFDFLPVPAYRKYLDETIGPDNWEDDVRTGDKNAAVTLSIFGVRKSSSSSIWPAAQLKRTRKNGETYYIDNPQPNETEKAEARAWRRAAAKHGLLSYLWDKEDGHDEADEHDAPPARQTTGYHASTPKATNGQTSYRTATQRTEKSTTGGLSDKQVKTLTSGTPDRDGLHVPMEIVNGLTPGFGGTASKLIGTLFAIQKDVGEDEYYANTDEYIRQALAENDIDID